MDKISSISGRRIRSRFTAVSTINVTPLVDVMLVLLIVFMITAPLLATGVAVDLPRTDAPPLKAAPVAPIVVTIRADGSLYVQERKVERETLSSHLVSVSSPDKGATVFIRADRSLSIEVVLTIMSDVTQAGYSSISLVSNVRRDGK